MGDGPCQESRSQPCFPACSCIQSEREISPSSLHLKTLKKHVALFPAICVTPAEMGCMLSSPLLNALG